MLCTNNCSLQKVFHNKGEKIYLWCVQMFIKKFIKIQSSEILIYNCA